MHNGINAFIVFDTNAIFICRSLIKGKLSNHTIVDSSHDLKSNDLLNNHDIFSKSPYAEKKIAKQYFFKVDQNQDQKIDAEEFKKIQKILS